MKIARADSITSSHLLNEQIELPALRSIGIKIARSVRPFFLDPLIASTSIDPPAAVRRLKPSVLLFLIFSIQEVSFLGVYSTVFFYLPHACNSMAFPFLEVFFLGSFLLGYFVASQWDCPFSDPKPQTIVTIVKGIQPILLRHIPIIIWPSPCIASMSPFPLLGDKQSSVRPRIQLF